MALRWPPKDLEDVDIFYVVWCSLDGTNDGSSADDGILQGETISAVVWTVPSGITKDASSSGAVSIQGVNYAANTVTQITLSGGTADTEYTLKVHVTTTGGREFDQTVKIEVKEN